LDGVKIIADTEAEASLLAAVFYEPRALERVSEAVEPADFWDSGHQAVYAAMVSLYNEHQPVNVVTVIDQLKQDRQLDSLGGGAYVTSLVRPDVWAADVDGFCKIVSRLGVLRRTIDAASQIARLAYQDEAVPDEVLNKARSLIDSVSRTGLDDSVLSWTDSLGEWMAGQVRREDEQERKPMRFPWDALSRRVPWLRPGMLVVVGADSGVGKTAFLENCAEYWSQVGYRTSFFHFELSHQVMLDRRMARWSGVPITRIEEGILDQKVNDAIQRLSEWRGGIEYIHCPGWTMSKVAGTARKLAARGLADAVIVDYLQKARLNFGDGLTPAQVRGQQVEVLKVLAEQLAIPVLLASQVNRTAFLMRQVSRHALRDSGEIEEKANVVVLLQRDVLEDDLYSTSGLPPVLIAEAGSMSPQTKVVVDKNTMGQTGVGQLLFTGPRFSFEDK
jgi:replicative DNA helicase